MEYDIPFLKIYINLILICYYYSLCIFCIIYSTTEEDMTILILMKTMVSKPNNTNNTNNTIIVEKLSLIYIKQIY